ncbi:hypothetical protein BDA96_03G088300 [Sorghum bicolor]|uniref:Uncharacterized protein n=2 Tax=Sorghum bicolor TaxID=4558 RepID=A0A921UP73_SORBI|nr:hypothetical protein BDA96_03G088300 [Sorghum bicolor]KXG31965.1 hypothetical protein SORBI_3003G084600 [Sorghum bicolor]
MKVKYNYYFLILVCQSELFWQRIENLCYYLKGSITSCIC